MGADFLLYLNFCKMSKDDFAHDAIGNSVLFVQDEHSQLFLDGYNFAVIGIPDSRNALNNDGCDKAPDIIRQNFYVLNNHFENIKIVDLGNVKQGKTIEDTYAAAKTVINSLLKMKLFVIILGGSNDMLYANYLAYEEMRQMVNITSVDSRFDLSDDGQHIDSQSYFNKIIAHSPNYLFDYSVIGYQSYYVNKKSIELMDSLNFDTYRLGVARSNMADVEPSIRNSDIVSIDMSSVKSSDAPANAYSSPNGFSGDEICTITRFVGCSDKVSSVGIYEYNPSLDIDLRTAKLIGQMLWYLVDGYNVRTGELPNKDSKKFIKYHVNSTAFTQGGIVFYKSKQTDRWWMEVECPDELKARYSPQMLVSCSYNDYLTASNNSIPERWIQVYKKLMQ